MVDSSEVPGPVGSATSPRRSPSAEPLIDAAISLIAERGYAAMSVDAVCRKSGIVKSGLYWNFGSKEGLLNAVVDRVSGEWVEEIRQSAYRGGDPMERLDRTLLEMRTRIEKRPEGLRVLLVALLERSSVDPVVRGALARFLADARSAIAKGIVDAIGIQGECHDMDVVADLLVSMVIGVFMRGLVETEQVTLDREFRAMREVVVHLVRRRIAPPNGASVAPRAIAGGQASNVG